MKSFAFSIVVVASACGTDNNPKDVSKPADTATANAPTSNGPTQRNALIDEIVTAYVQLKNGLTKDNGREAAEAGKQLHEVMQRLDNSSLTAEQKKTYNEVKENMLENAEHISANATKINHQREHFDVLSQDMYDLVMMVKPGITLYKQFCPMYNDNKGAFWLSEEKEIKNPYFGKKMLHCGDVKEEIKQ